MQGASELSWHTRTQLNRCSLQRLANRFITPFTPFVLSDWYISNEIDGRCLRFLNPQSRRFTSQNLDLVNPGQVVFVQIDQLDLFESLLPGLGPEIVLITGKWQLPGFEDSEVVRRILASGKVSTWWSQNQVFKDLPIRGFPYGLDLFSLHQVERLIVSKELVEFGRRKLLAVPNVRIHDHLSGRALEVRQLLVPHMSKPLPLRAYLNEMGGHQFILSPRGDRPDTYRNYEAIAVGAIPVTDLPESYGEVLARSMICVDSLVDIAMSPHTLLPHAGRRPDSSILNVCTWRRLVLAQSSCTCEFGHN